MLMERLRKEDRYSLCFVTLKFCFSFKAFFWVLYWAAAIESFGSEQVSRLGDFLTQFGPMPRG